MSSFQQEIDARTRLAGSNQFELLLFSLGVSAQSRDSGLYGINVFKVREIVSMPELTAIAGACQYTLGVVHLREQVIPVYDLPQVVGCKLQEAPRLMIVTEYARSTQAFAVAAVQDIVRLDWSQVIAAENSGAGNSLVTSVAKLQRAEEATQLVQVLDVETILKRVAPQSDAIRMDTSHPGPRLDLGDDRFIVAADDSPLARKLLEQTLAKLQVPCEVFKSGGDAWRRLQQLANEAQGSGNSVADRVGLVLTDLEMPEMDGFTLTRNIKQDPRLSNVPVLIHSSLSGATNEEHARHAGADGFVSKFSGPELIGSIRRAVGH